MIADFYKADVLKHYIDWAVGHGFGVIDVNIPHFLTDISVNTPFLPKTKTEIARYRVAMRTMRLSKWIWQRKSLLFIFGRTTLSTLT